MPATYKFDIAGKRISTDTSMAGTPDALFADLATDTLYAAVGTEVQPMHGGVLAAATWRSRVIKDPFGLPTGFSWLRMNGALSAGAVVKLFADGALVYTTPTISNGEPRRLPAIMARAWEVEVSGTARVTSLVMSDTTEGLL